MDKAAKKQHLEALIEQTEQQMFAVDVEMEATKAEGQLAANDQEKKSNEDQVANQKYSYDKLKLRLDSFKAQLAKIK